MDRKIEAVLEAWYGRSNHKALVVRGPRQVGKSYSIREFGRKRYRTVIEINFEDSPQYKSIFDGDLTAEHIFDQLGFAFDIETMDGCLLFLDEIQCCDGAYAALKPLAADGRCDIICSGSVLSEAINRKRLTPVGSVETVHMEPMDFEEFLWAVGFSHGKTERIRTHIREMEPFGKLLLGQLNDLYRRYIAVGGMPEAVLNYAETGLYANSNRTHMEIYRRITDDVKRYASSSADRTRIGQCLDSVPHQLSREKSNAFLYSQVSAASGYGAREYGHAVYWLKEAGIVDICRNLEEISEPFRLKTDGNMFKIYMKDTGMLVSLFGSAAAKGLIDGDFAMNNGAAAENAVAEALIRKGYDVYYYSSAPRRMEIDFVLNLNGKLAAIEVKSGRKKRAKSLLKAMAEDKNIDIAVKVSESDLSVDENGVYHYPLFGPSFFEECRVLEPSPMGDMDAIQRML